MRLLACGDRRWIDRVLLAQVLDSLGVQFMWDFVLVHGAARGADSLAAEWAESRALPAEAHPADWDHLGRRAGVIRNSEMLASGVDLVVAFHDDLRNSKGTRHMVTIARAAEVPVKLVTHQSEQGPP
jgi:hypothetical protein